MIKFSSTGVKNGPLPKADYYIDCRVVKNPFHEPSLNGKSGDDPAVQQYVADHSNIGAMADLLEEAISRVPSRRRGEKDQDRPFEVLCFCAHGVHRSRSVKHLLSRVLMNKLYHVEVV